MIPSRRRKFAALALFGLLVGVVMAGMAWTTAATLELAKRNLREEHERIVSLALARLSAYVGGVLFLETDREVSDYEAFHLARPVETRTFGEPPPAQVLLPSRLLLQGPSRPWMELYFKCAPSSGEVSSPQLVGLESRARLDEWPRDVNAEARARSAWKWFAPLALDTDFHGMIEQAQIREAFPFGLSDADGNPTRLVSSSAIDQGHSRQRISDYLDRTYRMRMAQLRHTPPPACETLEVINKNLAPSTAAEGDPRPATTELTIDAGPIAPPFWLETRPELGRRLAFVRECRVEQAEDTPFYQGFIANWDLLRSDLLDEIDEIFPSDIRARVDIVPLPNDAVLDLELSKRKLTALPATLEVPFSTEAVSRAAWGNVGGVLLAGWGAAMLVLGVAGWGVRNLVSLSERRMQFAYAVTHELRTPLTTFRLYSDMLAAGLVPEESRREYLETLARESSRLAGLVQDVLEYARLEHHRVRLNPRPVDGESILSPLRETLRERCHVFDIEPLAETSLRNGRVFHVDVDVINRIVAVLISNACRHTRHQPVRKILVRLEAERDRLLLDVIDSGTGIEPGDSRSIFKPFRRGRGAEAAAQGGLGLGLALARDWATLLGGRLDLIARHHPQYGGAHFRLSVPADMSRRAPGADHPVTPSV